MAETIEDTHPIIIAGIKGSFMLVKGDLERITAQLALLLPPLDGTKLSEYKTALETIESYSNAVLKEIDRLYLEDKKKEEK